MDRVVAEGECLRLAAQLAADELHLIGDDGTTSKQQGDSAGVFERCGMAFEFAEIHRGFLKA